METSHKKLLALLMLGALLVVGQLYLTLPLSSALAAHWQVPEEYAAWTGSAFGFAYATGFLLLGRLSDRHGRSAVLLFSLVAMAAASVMVAYSVSFEMLLAARALQGLLAAAFPPAALALVSEILAPNRKALGISLMSFAFLASAPGAQFISAQLADLGLPTLMLASAAAYLLVAVGLYRLLPAGMASATQTAAATPERIWRQRQLMGAWLAALTVLFSFVIFHAGAQIAGYSATQLQSLRLAGLPPLLLSIAAARLISRLGAANTARVGLLLAATALLVGLAGDFWCLLITSILLSAGIALAVPGLISTIADRATPELRARAISLYTFFLFVGASAAPPAAQALASHGWSVLLYIPTAALLCAAAVVKGWAPLPKPSHPNRSVLP